MASDININAGNRRLTGINVQFPQRAIDVTITWVRQNGQSASDTRTVLFPNILNNAALPNGWLADQLEELCIKAVRIIAGIDEII